MKTSMQQELNLFAHFPKNKIFPAKDEVLKIFITSHSHNFFPQDGDGGDGVCSVQKFTGNGLSMACCEPSGVGFSKKINPVTVFPKKRRICSASINAGCFCADLMLVAWRWLRWRMVWGNRSGNTAVQVPFLKINHKTWVPSVLGRAVRLEKDTEFLNTFGGQLCSRISIFKDRDRQIFCHPINLISPHIGETKK